MDEQTYVEENWAYLLSFLPPRAELERSASELGAFRRVREIGSATELLRLIMVYGFCGLSLRDTAAWAEEVGLASISNVSLLERFRKSSVWLGHVLALKLADRAAFPTDRPPELKARLIDASSISAPGSKGIAWRVHLSFDLASFRVDDISVTDSSGGEHLSRFEFGPGEIVVGDRGYAHRTGLEWVVGQEADFLVRLNWSNLPLLDPEGKPVDVVAYCRTVPEAEPMEFPVKVRGSEMPTMRLLIVRKTAAAAAESRLRKERERRKKGKVDPRTLETSEYVILLTSAPTEKLSIVQAFELYRFRWQIELCFKRFKSLMQLDRQPAKTPELAKVFIFSKLLGALLVEDYTERYLSFSPWGYLIRADTSAFAVANH
jgi:hypothetical protein